MNLAPFDLPAGARVLVAGAGGGFDFLVGLPIALDLEERGHEVHLASYSFTELSAVRRATRHSEHLWEVSADSYLEQGDYFPERLLCRWYRERRGMEKAVWCLAREGVVPTRASYDALVGRLGIEAVVCVDGGVDGIFRGDEHDLGTPSMDSISVVAASLCKAARRIYACTAFGVEGAESEVCHAQALARMADLVRENALLGVGCPLRESSAGRLFLDAVAAIDGWLPPLRRSVVVSAVVAAMGGAFGPTAVHAKTVDRLPWLSPLTLLYWYFDAVAVARMKLFYAEAAESGTVADVARAIEAVRRRGPVSPPERIPI